MRSGEGVPSPSKAQGQVSVGSWSGKEFRIPAVFRAIVPVGSWSGEEFRFPAGSRAKFQWDLGLGGSSVSQQGPGPSSSGILVEARTS